MTEERIDPAYEYIDRKIKLLKRELRLLKNAHDTVANQLLNTQRLVASLKIKSDFESFRSIISDSQLSYKAGLETQLIADFSSTNSQLKTSNNPYDIALELFNKWKARFAELNIKVLEG